MKIGIYKSSCVPVSQCIQKRNAITVPPCGIFDCNKISSSLAVILNKDSHVGGISGLRKLLAAILTKPISERLILALAKFI